MIMIYRYIGKDQPLMKRGEVVRLEKSVGAEFKLHQYSRNSCHRWNKRHFYEVFEKNDFQIGDIILYCAKICEINNIEVDKNHNIYYNGEFPESHIQLIQNQNN